MDAPLSLRQMEKWRSTYLRVRAMNVCSYVRAPLLAYAR